MGEAGERGGSSGAPIAVGEKGQCHTHRTDGEAPAAPTRSRPPLKCAADTARHGNQSGSIRNGTVQLEGTRGRLDVVLR